MSEHRDDSTNPTATPVPENPLLAAALAYAARGWRVIPLHEVTLTSARPECSCGNATLKHQRSVGKHPRLDDWSKEGTTEATTIRAWWHKWPRANIGLLTGASSGLVVLDVDPRNGGDISLATLLDQHGPLPDTVQALSGGGGVHYYFAWEPDLVSLKPAPGLDFLAHEGCQVLAAPSLHPSGQCYTWELSSDPADVPLAPLPPWLRTLVQQMAQAYTAASATLPATLPTVDLQALPLPGWLRQLLRLGDRPRKPYPSRSEAVWAALMGMIDAGLEDATMAAILLDDHYGISDKPLSQRDTNSQRYWELTRGWVAKEIGRARAKWKPKTPKAVPNFTQPPEPDPDAPPLASAIYGTGEGKPAKTPVHNLEVLPYSNYTNALDLVRQHGPDLHWCERWQTWLVWQEQHWQRNEMGQVMQRAKKTVKRLYGTLEQAENPDELYRHIKSSLSAHNLKGMVELARDEPGVPVLPDTLDQHPWLLNCTNGTLDLHTGTLRPAQRSDLLTTCTPVPYDPEARCPTWDAFLQRIMGGSGPWTKPDDFPSVQAQKNADARAQRLIAFLQRMVGYSLTGSCQEEVLLILYGTGDNGKSKFLGALHDLFGPDYAQATHTQTFMVQRSEHIPNDLARLRGARVVTASESREGQTLNEELIKRATGRDLITARFLHGEFFDYLPTFKLFLACNHKPVIRGTDHAIWRRVLVLPFAVRIPEEEKNKTLDEKLRQELPGILAWAVRGCLDWQAKKGLEPPEEVLLATKDYRQEMDVLEQFLAECCVRIDNPSVKVQASVLYNAYKTWCEQEGQKAITQTAFGRRMIEKQYTRDESGPVRYWLNLGLSTTGKEGSQAV
jgi:putative DNA primase/helicase